MMHMILFVVLAQHVRSVVLVWGHLPIDDLLPRPVFFHFLLPLSLPKYAYPYTET